MQNIIQCSKRNKQVLTLTLTPNKIYFDINEKDKQQEIDNMILRYQ